MVIFAEGENNNSADESTIIIEEVQKNKNLQKNEKKDEKKIIKNEKEIMNKGKIESKNASSNNGSFFGDLKYNDLGILKPQLNFYYFLHLLAGLLFLVFIYVVKRREKKKLY